MSNPAGAPRSQGDGTAYAELEVLEPGPLTLVEDLGRPGLSAMGVGPSGAADVGAFALGARLLGQSTAEAALESHGGLVLRARGSVTVALTGAPTLADVTGVPVGFAAPFFLPDGAVLRLRRPVQGVRTYVSVRGGVAVQAVLGSRSRDTLSGIGPDPLRAGTVLPVGTPTGEPSVDVAPVAAPPAGAVELDVLPGPRLDWLAEPQALARSAWHVDTDSDRVGVRLQGAPLARAAARQGRELPSEGVVRGSVQVPADGLPVLFLADHPVTGGYPVVAVLTTRSSDMAAQLAPGQKVRLRMSASRPARGRG